MKRPALHACVSAAAIAAVCVAVPAFAADPAPAAATAAPADTLAEIVVTASTGTKTKLDSSVSISSVSADVLNDFHPISEGDALRLLPGLQPNVSGSGGNGNFAVRGLPVATGGATFVGLQEDGLPMVLYGDIQFGNNDYWTKSSPTDDRLEAIRGGTVATLASQAPGAVVNYISVTGKGDGGFAEVEKGLSYDWTKLSFLERGSLNDTLYYNVGGYYDVGHGFRHAGYNVSNSYLIKGNITKEFDGNAGYFRLLFKVADTHEPNDPGGLVCGNISGNSISGLTTCPGFNVKNQSIYSLNNANVQYVDYNTGGLASHPLDGISTKESAIQAQLHYKWDNGLTLDDNARVARMSGGFASNFFNPAPVAGLIGSTVNGATVARAVYANGPNAGKDVSEALYNNNVEIYTDIRNLDSIANNLQLNWRGDLGGGIRANLTAGWFFMSQKIAMDWHPGQFNAEASGSDPAPIDLIDSAGNLLSANGYTGYNNNWGAGVARTYDYTFTDNAPFADLILDANRFELDTSIRDDINHGSGSGVASSGTLLTLTQNATNPVTGASQAVKIPYYLADGTPEVINYTKSLLSWSVGASYKATDALNLFVRASRGTRFNADRLTFGGNFNANGTLNTAGQTAVADYVYQYEVGLKNRGSLGGAHYTVELTGYYSHFNITTFELNPVVCDALGYANGACPVSDKYKTLGVEFYGTLRYHGFSLIANMTANHAQQNPSSLGTFVRAHGIPDLSYSVATNYDITDKFAVGVDVAGVTSELQGYPSNVEWPGSAVFSANIKYRPVKNLEVGVSAYNLFNSLALQGAGNGVVTTSGGTFVGAGTAVPGRSTLAHVKFTF